MLKLAPGLTFLTAEEGTRILRAMGEDPGDNLLGVVVQETPQSVRMMLLYPDEVVGWDEAPALKFFIAQIERPHPSTLTPPAQPPDERSKACTRKETYRCE